MKHVIIILLFMQAALLFACNRDDTPGIKTDANGTVVSMPSLWKLPVAENREFGEGVVAPVIYQSRYVLMPGGGLRFGLPKGIPHMVDAYTGQLEWKWDDYQLRSENSFFRDNFCMKDNLLLHSWGSRTWVIDMNTGTTVWRRIKINDMSSSDLVGIGNDYYFVGLVPVEGIPYQSDGVVFRGKISSPVIEERIVSPDLTREVTDPNISTGQGVHTLQAFIRGQDTLLVIAYGKSILAVPRGISSKFGVYNVTRRQWEYKDIEFAPPAYGLVVDNLPQIHGDKVYHTVDRWITCHELATGREVWKQRFDGNFMFGGFVVVNGVLAANCEDLFLYGLDAQTGRRVWKTPSSGTASPMSVLNGVAYYSGGGDGHLYAVEVATGRTLWRLDSPDLKTSSAAFFYAAVAAVPGRDGGHGVVVAHTGLNVYGFEAAR